MIRTSSARMKHRISPNVLMISIHGLIISATMAMDRGQPWGMPHSLRWGAPIPPANTLYSRRFSRYALYAVNPPVGTPAAAATWYNIARLIWSKNFQCLEPSPHMLTPTSCVELALTGLTEARSHYGRWQCGKPAANTCMFIYIYIYI